MNAVIKLGAAKSNSHIIIHDLTNLSITGGTHKPICVGEIKLKLLHQKFGYI